MTRTEPGRARGASRKIRWSGVADLQSSVAPESGTSELDRRFAVPNFQTSELLCPSSTTWRHPKFKKRRPHARWQRSGATSRGCSRIGNSHEKVSTLFSPVPPPLPGCAGFPTSRPQQVDYGRLGSKEVAVGQGKKEKRNKKKAKKGRAGNDAADEA